MKVIKPATAFVLGSIVCTVGLCVAWLMGKAGGDALVMLSLLVMILDIAAVIVATEGSS